MNPLHEGIADYLKIRRGLGYKLNVYERHLTPFVTFLESKNAPRITTQLAVEFATENPKLDPGGWVQRMSVIRGFARYWHGKGRKERCTPLTRSTARVLKAWCRRQGDADVNYLFPNARGGRLSHDAVQQLVAKHVRAAAPACPTLTNRKITPHMLRHTAAMELLSAGIDRSLIAIWLGHESVETTQVYLDANLSLKEEILARARSPNGKIRRYKPGDRLLMFLRNL